MKTLTLADLLTQGSFTGLAAERMARVAEMTLDDTPLGALLYRLPQTDGDAREAAAAALVAAPVLLAAGYDRAALRSSRSGGDALQATFAGGERDVYVRVVAAANTIPPGAFDVNVLLNDAVDVDPKLWPRDTFVSVTFDPNLAPHVAPADPAVLVAEFLALLRGDRFGLYRSNDRLRAEDGFPTFARFGAWINTYPLPGRERGVVVINGISDGTSQGNLRTRIQQAVREAREMMGRHPPRPAWLVILAQHAEATPLEGVAHRSSGPYDPFEQVWISDGVEALPLNP